MQYPLTSLLARLSTGTVRGFLVASFHTALVLSLTFLARRASRFALDPLISRIFAPTKSPEQGGWGGVHFRNLNVAPPKDENPMPIADLLVDRAYGQSILSFMDGHLGYNLIFISKEDEAKTAFRCPGAVGRTDYSAGR